MQQQQQTMDNTGVPPYNGEFNIQQAQPVCVAIVQQAYVPIFKHSHAKVVGILLIVSGALSIILSVLQTTVVGGLSIVSSFSTAVSAAIMAIIAGSFGVGAAERKIQCLIAAFNVLSILTAINAGWLLCTELTVFIFSVQNANDHSLHYDAFYKLTAAFSFIMMALAAAILVASIYGSTICCRAVCCCNCCCETPVLDDGGQTVLTLTHSGQQVQIAVPAQQSLYSIQQYGTQAPPYTGYDNAALAAVEQEFDDDQKPLQP